MLTRYEIALIYIFNRLKIKLLWFWVLLLLHVKKVWFLLVIG